MLPLDDHRWPELEGGYRVKYDPRPAMSRLRSGDESAWDELWEQLHHQGDVGSASYAAAPHLLAIHVERDVPDWQTYAMLATIEICRTRRHNPPLPKWLESEYHILWRDIGIMASRDLLRTPDETVVRSILAVLAIAKGLRIVGELVLEFTEDEIREMMPGADG